MIKNKKIAIIGLGYVGLPLAVEFGKKYKTIGFDTNNKRINELLNSIDKTGETTTKQIKSSFNLLFSSNVKDISNCNIFIIAVPTPINKKNNPDLSILNNATDTVASVLKKRDIVIYESTVFPGCTEDNCVPILENKSKLKYNIDFFCGYSPERINPGDREKTLTKIIKITSGSNAKIAIEVDNLYKSIIKAGTHLVSSIRIAEAAKIIENCQRDINIAFVNELSVLFQKLGLDTNEVLNAAETKWNFLPFRPGLVGGHCIGVDPYYLTYKAKEVGYDSKIILSGRKLNDSMPKNICKNIINFFPSIKNTLKILILGITFKENCSDTRNSKVIEIYNILKKKHFVLDVCDPHANSKEVSKEYNINLVNFNSLPFKNYDVVIVSVAHKEFFKINIENYLLSDKSLVYDIKGIYNNKKYMRL